MPSGIAMYDSIGSILYEAEGVKIEGIPFKLKEESPSSVSGKAIDTILGDSLAYSLVQKGNNGNKKFFLKKTVKETDITYESLKEKPDMRISLLESSKIKGKTRENAACGICYW